MWPDGVVLLLTYSDDAFGMLERIELVHTEAVITEFPVEGLDIAVPSGLSWRDEDPLGFGGPIGQSITDEFWPVIHAQRSWESPLDGQ